MPATQFLPDKVSAVWKTVAWRGTEVTGGYLGTTRELREEKKTGLLPIIRRNRPHFEEEVAFLLTENQRTALGLKESLAVGTRQENVGHCFQSDLPQ